MADAITIKELIDARTDAKTLEEAVNGDAVTTVLSRLGETYPTLANALSQIDGKLDSADAQIKQAITDLFQNGGLPATPFATKALMTASALVDGDYAMVTEDTANNGLYIKTAGAWVKSEYNPELLVLDKVKELIELKDTEQADDLFLFVDNSGSTVMRVSGDGAIHIIGIDGDVAENINKNALIAESIEDVIAESIGVITESIEVITESIEKVDTSDNILEVKDVDGKDAMVISKDGELLLPKIGNISQELEVINSEILTQKEGKYTNGAKYADYAIAANSPYIKNINQILTKDYVASLGLVSHFITRLRVPSLLRISQYSYKVFFEARAATSDFDPMSCLVATIDVDPVSFETTASDITVIHESEVIDGTQYAYMQPVGIKLDNGDILCFYLRRFETTDHRFYMRKSVDNGVTWSEITDLTYLAQDLGLNLMIANSRGFVKRYGKYKGRLIVPIWHSGKTYVDNEYRSGYIYSDDNGASWAVADFAPYPAGNECQIAEATNGDLIISIRAEEGAVTKIIARQSEETGIYTQIQQEKELTEEKIMGGFIQGLNEYDFTTEKFIITTARTHDRKDLLIHTSYDNCKTWVTHTIPETVGEWVAYTCVESINAATLLVLWESEWTVNLTCAAISIHDLIKGEE